MMRVLLFGCGHSRTRRMMLTTRPAISVRGVQIEPALDMLSPTTPEWPDNTELHTWDINPDCRPTRVINLDTECTTWLQCAYGRVINFSHHFDEIHAYEVLEHLGTQGDAESFFNSFVGLWYLLKPGGVLFATVPLWTSEWAWGDPSHRRVITPGSLVFLSKKEYEKQLGKTPMSDFRSLLGEADFDIVQIAKSEHQLHFALRAMGENHE